MKLKNADRQILRLQILRNVWSDKNLTPRAVFFGKGMLLSRCDVKTRLLNLVKLFANSRATKALPNNFYTNTICGNYFKSFQVHDIPASRIDVALTRYYSNKMFSMVSHLGLSSSSFLLQFVTQTIFGSHRDTMETTHVMVKKVKVNKKVCKGFKGFKWRSTA